MRDLILFQSPTHVADVNRKKEFLERTPTTLYKYRAFDKYSFKMIDNNYAYLAPVKDLDDPFDCLNDYSISDFYNANTKKLTSKAIDYIFKISGANENQQLSLKDFKTNLNEWIDEGGINFEKAPKVIEKTHSITITKIEPIVGALFSLNYNFENIINNTKLDGFAENVISPGERVGILSLSEKRDNKVMWSLYGNKYEGYCVEYEIPKIKEVVLNLCPVIYTKRVNNSFMKKMLEYGMGAMLDAIGAKQKVGNVGAAMELFCTKDADWSYQAEWRFIEKAGGKCYLLNIKAIYLGFKVKKRNEDIMKKYAKEKGFALYKMNKPNGKKTITYSKII